MTKIKSPEQSSLPRVVASTTGIRSAGVMRSRPVKKMRLAAARATAGLLLLFTITDGSWAATKQQCEHILTERQALMKDSNQLGGKIAKMKTCSRAQIATAQKRYKVLDTIIRVGDWIVQNCPGYEVDKAGRSKNLSMLERLASFKNMCASTGGIED